MWVIVWICLRRAARLVDIARGILLEAEFRHLVNEFGVEEALLAGLCLGNPGLEGCNAVLVDGFIVGGRGERGDGERCDSENGGRPGSEYRMRNLR